MADSILPLDDANWLAEKWSGIAIRVANSFAAKHGRAHDLELLDELVAEAYLAIVRASRTFDPRRGFAPSTYMFACAFRCLGRWWDRHHGAKRTVNFTTYSGRKKKPSELNALNPTHAYPDPLVLREDLDEANKYIDSFGEPLASMLRDHLIHGTDPAQLAKEYNVRFVGMGHVLRMARAVLAEKLGDAEPLMAILSATHGRKDALTVARYETFMSTVALTWQQNQGRDDNAEHLDSQGKDIRRVCSVPASGQVRGNN